MHSAIFRRLRAHITSKTENKPQKGPHDVIVRVSNLDMAMAELSCAHMLLTLIGVQFHALGQHTQTVLLDMARAHMIREEVNLSDCVCDCLSA